MCSRENHPDIHPMYCLSRPINSFFVLDFIGFGTLNTGVCMGSWKLFVFRAETEETFLHILIRGLGRSRRRDIFKAGGNLFLIWGWVEFSLYTLGKEQYTVKMHFLKSICIGPTWPKS